MTCWAWSSGNGLHTCRAGCLQRLLSPWLALRVWQGVHAAARFPAIFAMPGGCGMRQAMPRRRIDFGPVGSQESACSPPVAAGAIRRAPLGLDSAIEPALHDVFHEP